MRMSRRLASFSNGGFKYTYTGTSSFVGDPKKDWILYLTGTGTLNIQGFPKGKLIDVCVIGGGGNGASASVSGYGLGGGGGGGGGGMAYKTSILPTKNTDYSITVGGANADSTAFGMTGGKGANGSRGGSTGQSYAGGGGGNGGTGTGGTTNVSGAKGGSGDASYDQAGGGKGANGNYAFGDSTLDGNRYGASGGGGGINSTKGGAGGTTGGGNGANGKGNGVAASAYGGGGGGHGGMFDYASHTFNYSGGRGANGVVIIRNHRQ